MLHHCRRIICFFYTQFQGRVLFSAHGLDYSALRKTLRPNTNFNLPFSLFFFFCCCHFSTCAEKSTPSCLVRTWGLSSLLAIALSQLLRMCSQKRYDEWIPKASLHRRYECTINDRISMWDKTRCHKLFIIGRCQIVKIPICASQFSTYKFFLFHFCLNILIFYIHVIYYKRKLIYRRFFLIKFVILKCLFSLITRFVS